jgi:hypothetical protein
MATVLVQSECLTAYPSQGLSLATSIKNTIHNPAVRNRYLISD